MTMRKTNLSQFVSLKVAVSQQPAIRSTKSNKEERRKSSLHMIFFQWCIPS